MTNTADAFMLAARNALSFLEDDRGFTLTETIAPPQLSSNLSFYKVTYRKKSSRSPELFVCLATAPVRLEQDLEFGRGWPPEYHNTINAFELLAIEAPEQRLEFTSGVYNAFGDVQKMSEQYESLASVLRNHGGRFFANDESLWDSVQQLRKSRIQQHEYEEKSRSAELAFKRNDWQHAVELLDGLGDNRTLLQTARLAYARKRAAK
ncbi:hypothetical protein Q31b_52980 [Novipirellula aureliae]|uniref:Uncharacterized protein n=1 Tax=Novipirellula aureliae TaxID=2527966 RepID=A0A5C6DEU7_9BACT|nr:hypothetical protein [Novipirellula aureliae]TWU35202.1 hypothetical protein Q31b_52980 [Novipirellula aureliae]